MLDKIGTRIAIGDTIAYTERERGRLILGVCKGFTEQKVKISIAAGIEEITYRAPGEVVCVKEGARANAVIAQTARTAHEVNKAYCESVGDFSQKEWKDAPGWQRASAIKGVMFHLENPEATPAQSHESWLKTKLAAGWSYGEVKNEEKKTHPCICPYEQLPVYQQTKDKLFTAVMISFK